MKKKVKFFRDATQGYVKIEENLVSELIDTFEMQRLKDVAQTGLRSIYSSATHDRFSHSLGVYNIGCEMYASFALSVKEALKNLNGSQLGGISKDETEVLKNEIIDSIEIYGYYYQIACILHDIGHPATSHTLEYLYLSRNLSLDEHTIYINEDELSRIEKIVSTFERPKTDILKFKLQKRMKEACELYKTKTKNMYRFELSEFKASPHEMMGALQILGLSDTDQTNIKLQEPINKILKKYTKNDDFITDFGFISAMIVGCQYKLSSVDPKMRLKISFRNCVIQLLNGKIDADSIDYLNRNSHFAGYATTSLDIPRLTGAFSIYYDKEKGIFTPCIRKNALGVIENFETARHFEPKWLYGHHKIVYCGQFMYNYLLKKTSRYLFAENQNKWEDLVVARLEKICLVNCGDRNEQLDEAKTQYFCTLKDLMESLQKNIEDNKLKSKLEKLINDLILCIKKILPMGEFTKIDRIVVCNINIFKETLDNFKKESGFWNNILDELYKQKNILERIGIQYNILTEIKNAYPSYLLAPIAKFSPTIDNSIQRTQIIIKLQILN